MSIKPPYDDYISVGKKSLPKPVFSENSHTPEKIDQQSMMASIRATPKFQSPYMKSMRSSPTKPLAEVTRNYVDDCVQQVAQVTHGSRYVGTDSPPTSPVKGSAIPGTQDRLQIDRTKQIGKGSFARVWSGTIQKPDQRKAVAVKEFKEASEERELFVVEQLRQTKSKGLLRIYGLLTQGSGRAHVVMKLCNQGSAAEFFNENITDKPACHQKLLSMLKVLQEFHKSGFCHRDIHEGNFLSHLPKKGGIQEYLADFGHAGSLIPEKQLPLNGRPIFLANSPRIFSKLYNQAKDSKNSQEYDLHADRYGREIDLFQMGMLCFRVCVAENAPIKMGSENHAQAAFVRRLTEIDRELAEEPEKRKKELYMEKMENLFRGHFPSIPPALRYVIIGLMHFPEPMPLDEAIARWEEGII